MSGKEETIKSSFIDIACRKTSFSKHKSLRIKYFLVGVPANVDERRASVGLGTLSDYIKGFDLEWDPEAYLEQLPEYEKLYFGEE